MVLRAPRSRPEDPLDPPLGRVVAGEDRGRFAHDGLAIGERGRHRRPERPAVGHRHLGRERGRLLDEALVVLDPPPVIEGDGGHRPAVLAVDGDEAARGERSLGNHDCIGGRRHADRLDVDAELARPERRDREVSATLRRRADHVVRRDRGLLDGVSPVLEREELMQVERVRKACDVAGDEHVVGDDEVVGEHAAAGVARDSVHPRREPRAEQPLGVADGPERDDRHVRLHAAPVVQVRAAKAPLRVALERGDGHAASQVDAALVLQLRGAPGDHAPQRAAQRGSAALEERHREAQLAACRGDLRAREAAADHQHALGPRGEPLVQPLGVVPAAQDEHTVELPLARLGPRSCARSGGDEHAIVREHAAVGEAHALVLRVELDGGDAEPPLDPLDRAPARQGRARRRDPAGEHGLRQRRAIVREMGLVADDRQFAAEALGAQRLGRAKPGQRGADDDDPAARIGGRGEAHGDVSAPSSPVGSVSTLIA
jgi:hypothetical protein